MKVLKRIKGTQDILPDETPKWSFLENVIHTQMALFNYKEMRTPTFEMTDLFARGIGELTDIVSKEMYTFQDRSRKSITLKPEMTAPIMRAYIENNLNAKAPVNKLFYITSLYRQENPQAGRLRQFNQYGAELIGSPQPQADVDTIALALAIFKALDLDNLELKINTVADPQSREPYKKVLQDYLKSHIKNPDTEIANRIQTNPLRVLDSKDINLRSIIESAPKLVDHLNEVSLAHFETVKDLLQQLDIKFKEDPTLVRGLDYYTHTVYEISNSDLGAQNALCGGGRYDLLAEQISGTVIPAVGFAAGMERILMVLEKQDKTLYKEEKPDAFIVTLGEQAKNKVSFWLQNLRLAKLKAETDFLDRSIKAQFREANRQQVKFVLVLGDNELSKQVFSVKNMTSGEQKDIPFDSIVNFLTNQPA